VEELNGGGLLGGDTVDEHPEEDRAVDSYQDVGGGSGEEVASPAAARRHGRWRTCGVCGGGEDFTFWIGGGGHDLYY
jgi:hypothetical protein